MSECTGVAAGHELKKVRAAMSTSSRGQANRNEPTSQRIQKSLLQLEQVLSPPHGSAGGTTTPPSLGIPHIATPLTGWSVMETTAKNWHLAPTPAHDTTQLASRQPRMDWSLEDTVLGEDATVLDDPTRKVSGDLIMAFHREVAVHNQPYQALDMIQALERCCEVQQRLLTEFEKETRFSVDQLQSELCMERATWQLFHVLARDRSEDEEEGEREGQVLGGRGASEKELAVQLFIQDSSVRQAQLVVDWLEGLARAGLEQFPAKAAYFADSICWENTLHDITHGIDSDLLVSEMDPDAPTRQQRKISALDARDELSLNKHIFTCIRAGQLDQALGLCVSCGQPLKAVMLEGWKLHHDPNVSLGDGEGLEEVEGNEFRGVWKASCWQMLDEPTYDVYEKAVFASLCGNIEKILPACLTWYDHMWAYFKTLVDVEVEKVLRRRVAAGGEELPDIPPQYWSTLLQPQQVFREIETSSPAEVQLQAHSHFHLVQKYIILDDMAGLVQEMASWLPDQPSLHRLRFMAHVGLVVRGLGRVQEEGLVDGILEAYVKALTECHYQSPVALYVAKLPASSQVSSYAHLLAGVRQEDEQKQCLELGKEAGLDIGRVTKAVVETIRSSGQEEEGGGKPLELGQDVSELDLEKIRAISWLVFEEDQRPEAIRQGNALMRQFFSAHKFSAAQAVLDKVPTDSAEVVKRLWQQQNGDSPLPVLISSALTELEAIQTYLKALEKFNCWFQHFHNKKPTRPTEPEEGAFQEEAAFEQSVSQYELEYEQWQSQATFLAEEAAESLQDVLVFPGGWMRGHCEEEDGREVEEGQQFKTLRETCIPEVCFLLHSVLHSSAMYKKCLQLSDVVASEKYLLYKDFPPRELRQLLVLLQRSALCLAGESATDELGYLL